MRLLVQMVKHLQIVSSSLSSTTNLKSYMYTNYVQMYIINYDEQWQNTTYCMRFLASRTKSDDLTSVCLYTRVPAPSERERGGEGGGTRRAL